MQQAQQAPLTGSQQKELAGHYSVFKTVLNWMFEDRATEGVISAKAKHPQGETINHCDNIQSGSRHICRREKRERRRKNLQTFNHAEIAVMALLLLAGCAVCDLQDLGSSLQCLQRLSSNCRHQQHLLAPQTAGSLCSEVACKCLGKKHHNNILQGSPANARHLPGVPQPSSECQHAITLQAPGCSEKEHCIKAFLNLQTVPVPCHHGLLLVTGLLCECRYDTPEQGTGFLSALACVLLCMPCPVFKGADLLRCASGAPIGDAHKQLITALTDHKSWSDRSKGTKDMMYQMLKVRSSMQELAAKHKVQ